MGLAAQLVDNLWLILASLIAVVALIIYLERRYGAERRREPSPPDEWKDQQW